MKFNHFSSSEDFAVVCTKTLETEMRAGKISNEIQETIIS